MLDRVADPMKTRDRGQSMADFDAASAEEPPAPSQMFARLGALLVVALCFGLAAQLLVTPHIDRGRPLVRGRPVSPGRMIDGRSFPTLSS